MEDPKIIRLELADGRITDAGWKVLATFHFEMAGIRVLDARLARSRHGIEVTLPSYMADGKRRTPFRFVNCAVRGSVEKAAYAEYQRQADQPAAVTREVPNRAASGSTGPATVPVSVARVRSLDDPHPGRTR